MYIMLTKARKRRGVLATIAETSKVVMLKTSKVVNGSTEALTILRC